MPFLGGPALQFVPDPGSVTIGAAASPASFNVTMPAALQFQFQGILYQAVELSSNGAIIPSNGLLERLGSL